MAYVDNYEKYLQAMPGDIEKCKERGHYIAMGYTANLDVLMTWDVEKLNGFLDEYLVEEPFFREGDQINNLQDLARIVSYHAINGLGGEMDITNVSVCEYLESIFECSPALGGTCAQGAAALGEMNVPQVIHITDKCSQVCGFLNYSSISLVRDGALIPVNAAAGADSTARHMILQFSKGDCIRALGKTYEIPLSNRLIMDYDLIHKTVPVDKSFLAFCEAHTGNIEAYNISGFNTIIDMEVIKERLNELSAHYQIIKKNNPGCILYFEGAHYFNSQVRDYVFNKMADYVDILGMNEEEFVHIVKQLGYHADIGKLQDILTGMEKIKKAYPAKGIVMHTKDYAMYYGDKLEGVNIEKGLTLGNLLSGTRARIGKYGGFKDCMETLPLALSPTGLQFAQELDRLQVPCEVCLVPSRYMKNPRYTIGLGDTFVAGMQICFVR